MSFGSKVSGFFKGIKDKVTGWVGNDARAITEDTEIVAQEGTLPQVNNDHALVTRQALENTAHFDEISSDKNVKRLLAYADTFEAAMKIYKIPGPKSNAQEFLNEFSVMNGKAVDVLDFMQQRLTETAEALSGKNKKYSDFVSNCAHYAMVIVRQKQYMTKIQENIFDAVRSGDKESIPYNKSYDEVLMDNKLSRIFQETDKTDRTVLGHGQLNTVYTMQDYDQKTKVFKEGHRYATANEMKEVGGRLAAQSWGVGQGPQTMDLHSANRDVAVSVVDQLFGLNAAVKTSLAASANGNTSSMQELAAGSEADNVYFMTGKNDYGYYNALQQIGMAKYAILKTEPDAKATDEAKAKAAATNEAYKKAAASAKKVQMVDPQKASFIESCVNLSALDIIVGHVDRHNGNIMVSEKGVKGIDNDTSFSLRGIAHSNGEKDYKDFDTNDFKTAMNENKTMVQNDGQALLTFHTNFPKVTPDFVAKICSVTPEALRSSLKSLLTKEEIDACVNRTVELQKYLSSLSKDRIIQNWSELNAGEYIRNNASFAWGNKMNEARGNYMAQIGSGGYNSLTFDGVDVWKKIDGQINTSGGPVTIIKAYLDGKKSQYAALKRTAKEKLAVATIQYLAEHPDDYTSPTIAQIAEAGHFDSILYQGASELIKHTTSVEDLTSLYSVVFGEQLTPEKAQSIAEENKAS